MDCSCNNSRYCACTCLDESDVPDDYFADIDYEWHKCNEDEDEKSNEYPDINILDFSINCYRPYCSFPGDIRDVSEVTIRLQVLGVGASNIIGDLQRVLPRLKECAELLDILDEERDNQSRISKLYEDLNKADDERGKLRDELNKLTVGTSDALERFYRLSENNV